MSPKAELNKAFEVIEKGESIPFKAKVFTNHGRDVASIEIYGPHQSDDDFFGIGLNFGIVVVFSNEKDLMRFSIHSSYFESDGSSHISELQENSPAKAARIFKESVNIFRKLGYN